MIETFDSFEKVESRSADVLILDKNSFTRLRSGKNAKDMSDTVEMEVA